MKTICRALALLFVMSAAQAEIFRSGDELIVRIPQLDALRQAHPKLDAVIVLNQKHRITVNLSDPVFSQALALNLGGLGACGKVEVEVKNAAGAVVHEEKAAPVAVVEMKRELPLAGEAAIEPGFVAKRDGIAAPVIRLPDITKFRTETVTAPSRTVTMKNITYSVVADRDLPVLGSQNYVLVSRQSFSPDDATKCSLYFSYRKAVCDAATLQAKHWRKFLVEVPLDRAWLSGGADETITLPLDGFAIHTTVESQPGGGHMLGDSSAGLAQGGQSADTDDDGRIYFTNVQRGAGLARFNPHTRRFEQPPVDLAKECRALIPQIADWRRDWDTSLGELLCTRGRIFIVYSRNYRVRTPNGNVETCSGVISLPQDHWDDAEKFRADIRLHAGSWEGAPNRLYPDEVPVNEYSRKILGPVATQEGLWFSSAPGHHGGPWELQLDGDAKLVVKANPSPIVKVNGLAKQRAINVGSAGRQVLRFDYGECALSRAALALILPSATLDQLVDKDGRYRSTFAGAPSGELTVRFDIAAKLQSEPQRHGELAAALSGISQGPAYCVTAIPGEPDQVIGVCEYGYYFSKLDFSRRKTEGRVFKSYLPLLSGGRATTLPAQVGLGPYNTLWAAHDDAQWLYVPGYIGMTRLKYAERGKTPDAFATDVFYTRLQPQPIDATPRAGIKDFRELLPALSGRMLDIGRGRPGRGGGAFSTGVELFDPRTLGESQTAVFMSRCFDLWTPVSRVVIDAMDGRPLQQVFAASSGVRAEYVREAKPEIVPLNREPKIFSYSVQMKDGLRDEFGFALPGGTDPGEIALSPCGQFLVVLQGAGMFHTWSIAQRQFVDGMKLCDASGKAITPLQYTRPGTSLWSAPDGRVFIHTALAGITFIEITVAPDGTLGTRSHLMVSDGKTEDFERVVRCFMPGDNGAQHLIIGGSHSKEQPIVRVIENFIAAQ
jgi:hypothetical protein